MTWLSPALRAALGVVLLGALILLPSRPDGYTIAHFARLPLELPVIVLLLCLLPRRSGAVLRLLVVALLGLLCVLRLADLGMVLAFRRNFNPVLDLHLLPAGWDLASGTFGAFVTALGVTAVLLAALGVLALTFWALGGLSRLEPGPRRGIGATAALVFVAGLGWSFSTETREVEAPVIAEVPARVERFRVALRDEARFASDLRREDLREMPDFAALQGRDVIFLFVESYGRSWLEEEPYRETGRARLRSADERLSEAGFAVRSGWFRAPTRGGQSWLAHGAVMSGLWTSSQPRYDALIASDRPSLNALFGQAGWHTTAVMPAITRAWPEAEWFAYDEVFAKDQLGYAGEPFEWVTMPDQYTLGALDRLARAPDRPDMVEAALITSHAPWTPTPEILPWDMIGDGAVFDGSHRAGDTPREVWSAPETIRAAYSRSLDYALEVIARWIVHAGDDALIVVLGDHQPAPLVAGETASAAVPLHVIARDPALLDRLSDGWTEGMIPAADLPERSMTELRALFASCFSSGGCAPPREGS